MQCHAYAHPAISRPVVASEASLRFTRRHDGIARGGEGDEKRVALGPKLATRVSGKRRAQQLPMLGQHGCIPIAELVQQARRAFDVRKQEGDSPARHLRHRLSGSRQLPREQVVALDGKLHHEVHIFLQDVALGSQLLSSGACAGAVVVAVAIAFGQ